MYDKHRAASSKQELLKAPEPSTQDLFSTKIFSGKLVNPHVFVEKKHQEVDYAKVYEQIRKK